MIEKLERPDFSEMSVDDLAQMAIACAFSDDPSDKQFSIWCREEISKRKPEIECKP